MEEDRDRDFSEKRRGGWARLIRKVWLADPELCEKCGARLKIVAAISSPQQDDLIEAILRSREEWSPPWLRRARLDIFRLQRIPPRPPIWKVFLPSWVMAEPLEASTGERRKRSGWDCPWKKGKLRLLAILSRFQSLN